MNAGSQQWTRVLAATALAFELHGDQRRKQGAVPYIGHLLGVASLVVDDGGDEDQVVAALLHDAAEDQGGHPVLSEVARRFGPRAAAIVEACTDTMASPKPPWRARKVAWLARLPDVPDAAWPVIVADKLHNARAVVSALRTGGVASLDVFNGGRDGTLWYYRAVADVAARCRPGPMVDELLRTVDEMERLAATPTT